MLFLTQMNRPFDKYEWASHQARREHHRRDRWRTRNPRLAQVTDAYERFLAANSQHGPNTIASIASLTHPTTPLHY